MNTHAGKSPEDKSRSAANAVSQKKSNRPSDYHFTDNRPEAIAQRKLQMMADNSPRALQLRSIQEMADKKSQAPAVNNNNTAIQRQIAVNVVSDNPNKKKIRAEGKVKYFKDGTKAGNYGWVGVTSYRSHYEITDGKYTNSDSVGPLHNDFTNPEAGHVLANQNGGDGSDSENVFAQDGGTNNGKYKSFEIKMRKDLDLYEKNDTVKFTSYLAGKGLKIGKIADEGLDNAMSISSEDTDSD